MKALKWLFCLSLVATILSSCTSTPSADLSDAMDAFKTLNGSIDRSNQMIDEKNRRMRFLIEKEQKNQPEKVNELIGIVREVQNRSKEMDTYIRGLMIELSESGSDGDVDIVNRLLAEGRDGDSLRYKLETYKKDISALMNTYRLPAMIPIDVTPPGIKEKYHTHKISWQKDYFGDVPKIAAITFLCKFENDIKNTEAMCIDRLAKEAVATDIILDRFEPVVSAKSTYISLGEKYEASIELGASSETFEPQIVIGGKEALVKNGRAGYTALATTKGSFTVPILIKIPCRRNNSFEEIKGELKYTVR